ncbi:cytosine deaminase [Anaerovorax odorimutans]|uniref:cytosine deaminase n=1 Tax=Anaerovorax odorimutans TaxID=109327 RepID=UPI0004070035|nr:cytosine deaminase [Anaerovorax odorimutans]
MLIKNIVIENSAEITDIRIKDGKFERISKDISPLSGEEVIDCKGCMALPPFVESHVHLDTCLTAGDPCWNLSGTLFEGIECWAKRKEKLSKKDIKERAGKAIRMQASNGVQFVRTHVDVTDPTLIAIEAMLELKQDLKDIVDIQIVAFPQEGIMSYPNGEKLMENAVKMGADCIGAIPHFEFTREYSVESLNFIMKLAEKHNKLVDVHCDEIDDEASRGLETLACRAYEYGMGEMVTASHTTAMHSYNNAYVSKLFRLLKMSKINFVSNPLVNTHLQGRMDTYPKRRGVTRVKELLEAGINVSFGHDDIFDPWYPLGTGNMRDVLHMGLHVCQMMGYEEILNSYKLITHNGAKTLHLSNYGIKEGNPADFIVLNADNFYNALNEKAAVLYSYRKGKLIASETPSIKKVLF